MPDKDPLNISGQVVAEKYRIEHLVGEGGFAMVYLAEHTIWKQPVAVKFFSGLSQAPAEYRDELLHQFIQEGALLTELSSQTAGIVQARDVGAFTTRAGQWMPFMVLEWLDGSPLDAILAEDQRLGQPWTEGEVVSFLRRILPILDVAHRRGVAHRDIKPANIFIMGSAARSLETPCKLLDFGVAKMVSDQAHVNAALAKTGMAITSFTPRYGAPEQFARSYGATGPWTDVYSVALLACEMFAGRVALQGDDLVQFGFSSSNPAQRPTPRFLGAPVSEHMEAVFAKALAVRPEDRFQNAGEFLEGALTATVPGTTVAPAVPSPHPASSTSLQLAQTVLVRSEGNAVSPATTRPAPPPGNVAPTEAGPSRGSQPAPTKPRPPPEESESEESRSGVGSLIFILVVLVGGFVGYSTTDIKGAREVREFFSPVVSPVVRLVRKEAAQQLPKLREKTRQVMDNAAGILAEAAPACPPGSQLVTSVPAHEPEAHSGSGEHGPSERVCVDEHLVGEIDYDGCAVCEQPGRSRAKKKTRGHSEYCIDGKAPTTDPIRCVTWKQADIYCAARAARLPTENELRTLAPTLILAPMEWTSATPEADRDKRGPFRCAHDQ
jgi:eukaryotic-like serine/threonine-protein kinase